jgi:hypothetical protein
VRLSNRSGVTRKGRLKLSNRSGVTRKGRLRLSNRSGVTRKGRLRLSNRSGVTRRESRGFESRVIRRESRGVQERHRRVRRSTEKMGVCGLGSTALEHASRGSVCRKRKCKTAFVRKDALQLCCVQPCYAGVGVRAMRGDVSVLRTVPACIA